MESLDSRRDDYVTELLELCPATILQAIEALHLWDRQIESLPRQVEIPDTGLALGSIPILQATVTDFIDNARSWWKTTDKRISEQSARHDNHKLARTRDLETIFQLKTRITETAKEVAKLTEQVARKEEEQKQCSKLAKDSADRLIDLDTLLKPFASLAEQIKAQQRQKLENRQGYEDFLQAKKLADELSARKEALDSAKSNHENARKSLNEKRPYPESREKSVRSGEAGACKRGLSKQTRGGHFHSDEPDARPKRNGSSAVALQRMAGCLQ